MSRPITLLAALLAASAGAQSVRITGEVLDRAGKPVAGAAVTLRSFRRPMRDDLGPAHVIEVATKPNGRFRAELLPGRGYSAWARLPGNAARFTEIEHDVQPGRPCVLKEAPLDRIDRRITVRGLEAWQKTRGPFTFRLVTATVHFEVLPLETKNGTITFPAVPGKEAWFEVVDRDGNGFWQDTIPLRKRFETDRPDLEVRIPAPLDVPMRVVSLDGSKPIAGAQVSIEAYKESPPVPLEGPSKFRQALCPLGRTDAGGRITVAIPYAWDGGSVMRVRFVVEAEGYVTTNADFRKLTQSLHELEDRGDKPPLIKVKLRPGFVITGKVVGRDGKPIAGLGMLSERSAAIYVDKNVATWQELSEQLVRTGPDGIFRISGWMPTNTAYLEAFPTDRQLAKLIPEVPEGHVAPPSVDLWHGIPTRQWRGERNLGELGRNLRWVPILVVTKDGASRFPNVMVARREGQRSCEPFQVAGDRRGRVLLALSPGEYDIAAYSLERGFNVHQLALPASDAEPQQIELSLRPFHWVTGKMIDRDGKPIANATMQCRGSGTSGYVPSIIRRLNRLLIETKSDEQGRFRVPFVPHPRYYYALAASDRWGWSNNTVEVSGDEDIEGATLVFESNKRR